MKNIIIIGAAGRDFHNFNTYYRDNKDVNVVAFTATQIPGIAGRKYPGELSGSNYPDGIPIYDQEELPVLIKKFKVDECVFSYSDVPYSYLMNLSSIINANGANFTLLGLKATQLISTKPVIAIGAIRTGCGKSQTSRKIIELLIEQGLKVIAIRHPMPYGDLLKQKIQRFSTILDLKKHECTIEEMEEYEPHIKRGNVIYAGVDYKEILEAAENDPDGCDVIVWDGGNNDFPFIKQDLMITVTDPLRAGNEVSYYPGEVCLQIADVVIVNKIDSASFENIQIVRDNIYKNNPNAIIIDAASPIKASNPELIKNKKVLIIEDGPTLTHGEMKFGAGTIAAYKYGAKEIINPRPYLYGKIKDTFEKYPNIGNLLPAMGYDNQQIKDLEITINNSDCDTVIIGTPINLGRIIKINKPYCNIEYELQEIGYPNLKSIIDMFIKNYI